ncbi:MerR family transcriptional regulator [Rhodococcus pyridinivorans]|uniref:DNA-binding protein n=1 Tax=Rhodococcus pyridinivorans TaxID=103816 RepID=A0A7M2XHM6_9NOCA|nr:DNA-binding protein [Rhodococcus pyridinivorans]QOV97238.1 DNA-binding protein [Rhodococcus pyridinivorans]
MARKAWTAEELRAQGLTVPARVAFEAAGIGETHGYRLAKSGELPFEVLKIGRKYRVPVASLLKCLGIENETKVTA